MLLQVLEALFVGVGAFSEDVRTAHEGAQVVLTSDDRPVPQPGFCADRAQAVPFCFSGLPSTVLMTTPSACPGNSALLPCLPPPSRLQFFCCVPRVCMRCSGQSPLRQVVTATSATRTPKARASSGPIRRRTSGASRGSGRRKKMGWSRPARVGSTPWRGCLACCLVDPVCFTHCPCHVRCLCGLEIGYILPVPKFGPVSSLVMNETARGTPTPSPAISGSIVYFTPPAPAVLVCFSVVLFLFSRVRSGVFDF